MKHPKASTRGEASLRARSARMSCFSRGLQASPVYGGPARAWHRAHTVSVVLAAFLVLGRAHSPDTAPPLLPHTLGSSRSRPGLEDWEVGLWAVPSESQVAGVSAAASQGPAQTPQVADDSRFRGSDAWALLLLPRDPRGHIRCGRAGP